jgi:heptosyltransferase-3
MGDVILALPAARAIRLTYPDAKLVFLGKRYTAPLLRMCPWLDGIIEADRLQNDLLARVREYGFEAAVCLWSAPEVVRLLVRAKIPLRVGTGTRLRSWRFHRRLFEHRKWGLRHEVYYNLNIARLLGIKGVPDPLWDWEVPKDADHRVGEVLSQYGAAANGRLVVLHPGSGRSAEDWTLGGFGGLARRLRGDGIPVVLTGSDEEREVLESISSDAGGLLNLGGELSIPELAALFRRSSLVVANSTGPMHLANSLGVPVIGLYPLNRSMHPRRWGPLGQLDRVVTPNSLGNDMGSIGVGRVADLAGKILSKSSPTLVTRRHIEPPMSVLITITCPWWNAAAHLAVGLASGLAERGHRVWVMGKSDSPALDRAGQLGLETIGLPLHRQDPVSMVGNVFRIRSMLAELPVTLVNAHCPMGHSHIAAALWGMGRNTPLVRSVCDPRPPKRHASNRWLHQERTDAVVVTCEESRKRYAEVFPGIIDNIYVIPGGIDPAPFLDIPRATQHDRSGEVWIGMVSRLSPVKGHEVFVRAAEKVSSQAPNARFVISGEEAQIKHEDLKQLAKSLGIGDRVEIGDKVDDVREVLQELDIGVVASVGSEVMCRIALEMMASGLPVVGARINAVGEAIRDGVTGLVVPPGDSELLAGAILTLIRDSSLRRSMGDKGRERVISELSMVQMVERMEELYRRVLSQRTSEYMQTIGEVA